MAFDNVEFPFYPTIHGSSKTVTDPVSVSSNGTYEYRVKRTRWERYSWKLPTQTMTDEQKNDIKNFLVQRQHGLNSFRFVDRDNQVMVDNILSHNSTDKWNLTVALDATTPGTHPIFNPEIGGLTAEVNGTPTVINAFGYLDGQPVITLTGTTGTETVTVSGPLFYTVRLASDFSSTIVALDCNADALGHSTDTIALMEVFGEY